MAPETTTLAQPWLLSDGSRVRGTQLTGDLAAILSLEEEAMPARRALIVMSWHLRRATHVGNPAPILADMYESLRQPEPGDLVVESTSTYWAAEQQRGDWHRGVGILLLRREESGPYRDVTYVQYGPAPDDVCRWSNCIFALLPCDSIRKPWYD